MSLEIFISHSHQDSKIAEALVAFLNQGVGIEVNEIRCTSYLPTGIAIGEHINRSLRRDLDCCRLFIPLITAQSARSSYVAFEIGAAWGLNKKILPLTIGPVVGTELPAVLANMLSCDLTKIDELVKLGEEVAREVFVWRDQPRPSQVLAAAQRLVTTVTEA